MIQRTAILILTCLGLGWALPASAGIVYSVGSGSNQASLVVNFSDGAEYLFETSFSPATVTGLGLFDIIEAETTLVTTRLDFGFGLFVDGIDFAGHANSGFGGGEDFWHYWTREAGTGPWVSSLIGAADRGAGDGAWDGWVYGTAAPPGMIPEPASGALLALGGALLARRRRK